MFQTLSEARAAPRSVNRKASAVWKGSLRDGTGTMSTESGALNDTRYSFREGFDKGIGTNHVLPTGKAAKYTGGLWVGKFLKTVTWQQVSAEGNRQIAPIIAAVAAAEGMEGHAITARIRVSETAAHCIE